MTRRRRAVAALAVGAATLVGACGAGEHPPVPSVRLQWHASRLPAPAGERAVVRAATWCAGRWVVVGATADADGRTRPAVWTSPDARTWQSARLRPGRDYYTEREILGSVACSGGRLALMGAKPGGAHGMPRTATWQQEDDGSLAAVRAPYLLFGGTESVAVARLAGGSQGYLITGTRVSGAAVWHSTTGAAFRLYDDAPGLANTPQTRTQALDSLPYHGRWLVAGDLVDDEGRLHGAVWTGDRGGPWRQVELPGGSTLSTAERVVRAAPGPDVAGLLDGGFGLWALRDGSWTLDERFGEVDPGGTGAAYVSGLAAPGGLVAVTYSDGTRFRLWVTNDVPMPAVIPVDGDRTATLSAHGRHLLLLTDDDRVGRAWLATVPRPNL